MKINVIKELKTVISVKNEKIESTCLDNKK